MGSIDRPRSRLQDSTSKSSFNISDLPPELHIVAPALLQLNRGTGSNTAGSKAPQSCSSSSTIICPIPILSPIPDCTDCQATATSACFNLHCDSCWADCASHCASPCDEGDDCPIAEPCYEEHCSPEACPDVTCPAEPCVGGATCGEAVVHCDTACFADDCGWSSLGNQALPWDPSLCAQGECYGILPLPACGNGLMDFAQGHNSQEHLNAYTHNFGGIWNHQHHQPQQQHAPYFHKSAEVEYFSHDHVASNNHHKRRKTESSDISLSSNNSHGYQPQSSFQPSWQSDMHNNNKNSQSGCHANHQFDHSGQFFNNNHWNSCEFDFFAQTNSNNFPGGPSTQSGHMSSFNNASNAETDNLDGLICGLSHVGASAEALENTIEHSPFCTSNKKRSRPASKSQLKKLQSAPPRTPKLPTRTSSTHSPIHPTIPSPKKKTFKAESCDQTTDFLCQWLIIPGQEDHGTCSQSFTSCKELDEHIQAEHTNRLGSQKFTCHWSGCSTAFKHRGKLNRHISGAHSHYHAYACPHCERTFCTKEQLKNHETTHTGERRYKCSFCDHTSATKTQHSMHIIRCHISETNRFV
ncbi:hypothetical protein EJ08DRAFT_313115 [Tothia fuscella]|uniref:C2H2-type domain-containing protein n=1 Tax=Tothia fuscella TaxID=1048955 RepID=A0A9P4NNN3_9PEZI|nr:hypothetical protein EJ08DRAFT_313115 [Tothia fuscella]